MKRTYSQLVLDRFEAALITTLVSLMIIFGSTATGSGTGSSFNTLVLPTGIAGPNA